MWSIDSWDTAADLTNWENTYTPTWPDLLDSAGTLDNTYGVTAAPSIVIINTAGVVQFTHVGNPGSSTLISEIQSLIPQNQPPVAAFVWSPASPIVNQAVTFDASGSSDPDGTIVSYAWTFGDGGTGTGVGPTHTYTTAGAKTVTLTVTDNGNPGLTGTTTKTVTVNPPAEVHDIAVIDVKASPTTVMAGSPVSVEVKVLNEGTVQETFNVNTYYDGNLIGTKSVTLSSGASTTLTFIWDTTGVSIGTYVIKAVVPQVPGETHIVDNEFIDGRVTIETVVRVCVDIKPGSWPNPINVKSKGVFAVAILGTKDFNVKTVDPTTVKLYIGGIAQGVSPIRWSYQDVATGDGYLDIVFHFDTQTVVTKLGLAGHKGETIPLIIKGNLYPAAGGLPIQGQDDVWILKV